MSNWFDVLPTSQIPPGSHHVIVADGRAIAVFNLSGTYYAIEDCCTHQGLPLSDGFQDNDVITCPFHGAKFSIKTGQVLSAPAAVDLTTFEVQVTDTDIVQVKV